MFVAFHLWFRLHATKKKKVYRERRGRWAQDNCYHFEEESFLFSLEPWPENTCKVGCTKNRLKETGRLAINCTSCTRLQPSLGRCGSKNFLRSFIVWKFSSFRSPFLPSSIRNGTHDNWWSIVVILLFVRCEDVGVIFHSDAFKAEAKRKHERRSKFLRNTSKGRSFRVSPGRL